jgi:two-component system CheB/CheR fusion protein
LQNGRLVTLLVEGQSPKDMADMPRKHPRAPFPIIGVGASAGGLEACSKLLDAWPADSGMAIILVQHLDPSHPSLLAELLAKHSPMPVVEASNGAVIASNHIYVIPPGVSLSVSSGTLQISEPTARHGARLPFDFLLESLAQDCGSRAAAIILSGTGADGSLGLVPLKEKQGFIIVQDPEEADYGGMPRSAIATGLVDQVRSVAQIGAALLTHFSEGERQPDSVDALPPILDILRRHTPHDFRAYKRGTLQRRISRRMALAGFEPGDMAGYRDRLEQEPAERENLAHDLLINVTRFFRDAPVSSKLEEDIIPALLRDHPADHPVRIWIAGCSTGEEAYSYAMLFHEAQGGKANTTTLQIFASDADADAIASARDGLYPFSIEADVSSERLAAYFVKEDLGYRVTPELRALVVFTVQDVLADPPFSRLDLVSCRNLLIYLGAEAQAKVIAVFHFALCKDGILVLGNAEAIADAGGRFAVVAKPERIYRRLGRRRTSDAGMVTSGADPLKVLARSAAESRTTRPAALADYCQQLVLKYHSPAAILINSQNICLYSLGPVARYLRLAPGHPSHDVLAMAAPALRTRLRSAFHRARAENIAVTRAGGANFTIAVQPVMHDGDDLLLVCFIETPSAAPKSGKSASPQDGPRIAELEQELEATRTELQGAIHDLERSGEEQRAINEEAHSVNEEFQSTNEELLTSKEELQSLNEELTALNSQLQETLERQRTTANDLQNVLYSTDVATLFLDPELNIRFFTPATNALFHLIPGDIGRPISDLHSLAADTSLADSARLVLHQLEPVEQQVETEAGHWFLRRIMPYRTEDAGVEGVVITFTDITERKQAAQLVERAKQEAELATVAKSRFLAVASHDLRQPLQTLALVQGLLSKAVETDKARKLVVRLDETLSAMTGMLNTLLDINQIEAGTVKAELSRFPVNDLLTHMRDEFTYHAQAKHLQLRVVPCSLVIETDRSLLEQMLRNLISNAIKYTRRGKILLGCRRLKDMVSIEILDTGIGIEEGQLHAIFDEYHQVDNAARERSRGLGLGLSIVQRLGDLLGHPVRVRSTPGKGTAFAVEVMLPLDELVLPSTKDATEMVADKTQAAAILIIEDDPEVRLLLGAVLSQDGHHVSVAADGPAALDAIANGARPDLILTDYNLPHGMDGLRVAAQMRARLGASLPVIILTGDISTETLRDVAGQNCVQVNKPVKGEALLRLIQRLLR